MPQKGYPSERATSRHFNLKHDNRLFYEMANNLSQERQIEVFVSQSLAFMGVLESKADVYEQMAVHCTMVGVPSRRR